MSFSDGEWHSGDDGDGELILDKLKTRDDNVLVGETSNTDIQDSQISKVYDEINAIFGSDLSNLPNVNDFQSSLYEKLNDLDGRLDLANNSTPNQLQLMLNQGIELQKKLNSLSDQRDSLLKRSDKVLAQVEEFSAENVEILNDIGCVRGVAQYSVWIQLIEDQSNETSIAVESGNREDIVKCYLIIKDIEQELSDSKCKHLIQYVKTTKSYWLQIVQARLVKELEDGVASLGWPFIQHGDNKNMSDTSKCMSATDLQELVKYLILIQDTENRQSSENQDGMNFTNPMKVLIKPLRKRFKFHFLGSKSTNNPAKPEWYITQLILWANLHKTFLDAYIQPVYDKLELVIPARLEFGYGLVSMAIEKLSIDLPLVQSDDVLLAHTIDEAIGFARDMASQLQYSSAQPSALQPLTVGPVFNRWLNMERKFAFEKLDAVVCGEGAWESELGDGLVPKVAESFLAVLLSVTERYKFLSAGQHRLQFLELQLQLLEDFRLRLVQLLRSEQDEPLQSNLCPILCTVYHLVQVLSNWGETPFFLQLEYQRCHSREIEMSGTVFDEAINKFEYLLSDMTNTIASSISFSIKARSREYRKDVKWFSLSGTPSAVLPAFCNILQTMSFNFESAGKLLPEQVFSKVWQSVAEEMGKFICEEVILQNRFNSGGVKQLENDINTGLLPIFGEFTSCPQAHFPVLMDSVKLLNCGAGTLILTLETLQNRSSVASAISTLKDLGITRLSIEQAMAVIGTRVDLEQ